MQSNHFLSLVFLFVLGIFAGVVFSGLNQNLSGFAVLDSNNLQSISQPSNYLNDSSFLLYKDRITIKITNATVARYENTESMLPFITNYSNGIIVVPRSEKDISVGDIVSFSRDNKTIVHRVVQISSDKNGTYFITQGDNSNSADKMIRFDEIKYKLVGILY